MLYLWWQGYFKNKEFIGPAIKPIILGWCAVLMLSDLTISMFLSNFLYWLPDFMEDTYDLIINNWAGMLLVAVAVPIVEEIIFRGIITRQLLKRLKPWKALLISGAIFGIIHINPAQIIPAFVSGIILGWVYYRTSSIIPTG